MKASPAGRWLGAAVARNGAVEVESDLSSPGFSEIFVIGDTAAVPGQDGKYLPGIAPVAKQQGEYVAALIAARVTQREDPPPFAYRDRGMLATIGRSSAVVEFGGIRLRGLLAWILWGLAHIYFLIGFRNRAAVFLDWAWSWLTFGRGARLITGNDDATSEERSRSSVGAGRP